MAIRKTSYPGERIGAFFILFAALVILYSVVSVAITGSIGLPVQKSITIDKVLAYSNIEDFEIDGDFLKSTSAQGMVHLNIADNSLGRYRYVTVYISRTSDLGAVADLRYRTEDSAYTDENMRTFQVREGLNRIHIANNNWSDLQLHLGLREEMYVDIDKVVLSKFPILPGNALLLFLIMAGCIYALWYFFVFRKWAAIRSAYSTQIKNLTSAIKNNKPLFLINIAIIAIATAIAAAMVFRLHYSDVTAHIEVSLRHIASGKEIFINVWQDMVAFGVAAGGADPKLAAAVTNGILEALFVLAVIFVFSKWLYPDRKNLLHSTLLAFVVFAAPPYYIIEGHFYEGISGINTWHNPTSFAVKPFIVLAFFLLVLLFEKTSDSKLKERPPAFLLGCLMVAMYFTTYGKISGLAIMAPAALAFALCWWAKSKFALTRLRSSLLIGAMFIPSFVVFILSYVYYFPEDGGSRTVFTGFEQLLSQEGSVIILRTVWILMLPLFITITRFKAVSHSKGFALAWLTYIFAFIEFAMFKEIGGRESHGNNSWGRHYALTLLMIMCAVEIDKMLRELKTMDRGSKDYYRKAAVFVISVVLMLAYAISGVLYTSLSLIGGDFYL